jgi:hypothetical protein
MGYSAVGALALVLPVSLTATALRTGPQRAVELSVAGPAPARGMEPLPAPPNELATGDVPAPAAIPFEAPTTTVAEVHERVATINGVPGPRSSPPASVPPADDPVVGRSTPATTIPATGSTASTVPGGLMSSSSAGGPSAAAAPAGTALPDCVADEFRLTVTLERTTYNRGETVRGSAILDKRSAGTCLLPRWWLNTSLLNGAGDDVSRLARDSGQGLDISATDNTCGDGGCRHTVETGAVFTNTFYWETVDCTNAPPVRPVPPDDSHCVPFPAGSYRVVSYWTGPGSGSPGIATLQLGP